MTNSDIDLAIVRYTVVARDYKQCRRPTYVTARCRPVTEPRDVYQYYETPIKHVNVCTADEN